MADEWTVEPEPLAPEDAVDFFAKKIAMPAEDFYALDAVARQRAFTVSRVAQLDMIQEVLDSLTRALDEGLSFESWQDAVGDVLEEAWGGPDPWRLETIFRTNVQSALMAGRWSRAQASAADRPYVRFDAVLDDRTTDVCTQCNGTTLRVDDPFWASHVPPLHFNCRSSLISLREEQAIEMGLTSPDEVPDVEAAEGFGASPGQPDEAEPSEDDYEPELWANFLEKGTARLDFDPDQPRDENGRWTDAGGGAKVGDKIGDAVGRQVAQAEREGFTPKLLDVDSDIARKFRADEAHRKEVARRAAVISSQLTDESRAFYEQMDVTPADVAQLGLAFEATEAEMRASIRDEAGGVKHRLALAKEAEKKANAELAALPVTSGGYLAEQVAAYFDADPTSKQAIADADERVRVAGNGVAAVRARTAGARGEWQARMATAGAAISSLPDDLPGRSSWSNAVSSVSIDDYQWGDLFVSEAKITGDRALGFVAASMREQADKFPQQADRLRAAADTVDAFVAYRRQLVEDFGKAQAELNAAREARNGLPNQKALDAAFQVSHLVSNIASLPNGVEQLKQLPGLSQQPGSLLASVPEPLRPAFEDLWRYEVAREVATQAGTLVNKLTKIAHQRDEVSPADVTARVFERAGLGDVHKKVSEGWVGSSSSPAALALHAALAVDHGIPFEGAKFHHDVFGEDDDWDGELSDDNVTAAARNAGLEQVKLGRYVRAMYALSQSTLPYGRNEYYLYRGITGQGAVDSPMLPRVPPVWRVTAKRGDSMGDSQQFDRLISAETQQEAEAKWRAAILDPKPTASLYMGGQGRQGRQVWQVTADGVDPRYIDAPTAEAAIAKWKSDGGYDRAAAALPFTTKWSDAKPPRPADLEVGESYHFATRPVSSWTDDEETANKFAGEGRGYVLKETVDSGRVYAHYRLFKNTYDENEFVVLSKAGSRQRVYSSSGGEASDE